MSASAMVPPAPPSSPTGLECPHCERELFTPSSEAWVSLARCPRVDCHRVMLVCSAEVSLRPATAPAFTAMSLETFNRRPRHPVAPRDWGDLGAIGLAFTFLAFLPIWMLTYASAHFVFKTLLVFTPMLAPALTLAVLLSVSCALDLRTIVSAHRRLRRVRPQALERAEWLPSSTLAPARGWGASYR